MITQWDSMQSHGVHVDLKELLASPGFRAVADSVRDYAIFLLDANGVVLTWNTGAQHIKGYAPREIIGQSFTRFYTEQDRAAGRPHVLLAEAARNGRVEEEGWRVRSDGSCFWADVVISRLIGPDGSVVGFMKVTRDLTDRRRAEEALRQSEERLRLMVDAVTDYAIFMLDRQGRVASWNPGAQRLNGYSAREIIGEHFSRFYPPEHARESRPERELEIATTIGRFEEDAWRVRKDGSRFWASVVLTPVRNAEGTLLGFAKVTRDLTARKRVAEEMVERARQQEAISELGLFALRTPELALVMERAVRTVQEILHVEDVRVLRGDDKPPPGARSVPIHGPERLSDFGALSVSPSRPLAANDFSFLQAVANVIAAAVARAGLEEQVRVAERERIAERGRATEAQEALQQRDEFISVAAHELRTPLTALQLKLQSLERTSNPDRRIERLGGAVRQTERLSRLIERLLDVSRIAQGRVEMALERFDLSALVRQVADDFRDPSLESRAPLQLDVPERVEGCWDRLRLEQVLVNLLSNAVKYGAGKPIVVSLEADDHKVRLKVADRGIGIAPDDVDRIFGRFQRAAPIRNYGGLGLGLYITRYIVEAHRGSIAVESELEHGSTFVVELPRWSIKPVDEHETAARAQA